MKTETPNYMASQELLWLQRDGTEVLITARIGTPYAVDGKTWACPAEIAGFDGRQGDFFGGSSMQALNMAMRMVATRLGHLVGRGEHLASPGHQADRWDRTSLENVFGAGFPTAGQA